jgi:heat shock protein HspQ
MSTHIAKFGIGQIVRHRTFPFRGVIFDVDPEYANSESWWLSIPAEERPRKEQPFYHLLAEGEDEPYVAYVSEQNLVADDSGQPISHPETDFVFAGFDHGHYRPRQRPMN